MPSSDLERRNKAARDAASRDVTLFLKTSSRLQRLTRIERLRYSGRALGGHIANAYYGRRDATRDKVRDENRIREAQPKFIEAALKEQRNRLRSRRREKSICPDPVRAIRRFLRDPVTRFWLGCNLCCFGSLFLISFLFLGLLYPTVLRPITKY